MKYIGIDVGTSHIKVIVYEEHSHQIIGKMIEKTPVYKDRFNGLVHDPIEIRNIVFRLVKETIKELDDPADIKALSVASFGEEIVLLDEQQQPTGEVIVWYDQRGKEEAKDFLDQQEGNLFQGLHIDPSFSLFKLLWIKKYKETELSTCKRFIDLGGYILGCFSGEYVMDWSHASRTGAFNIFHREWDQKVIEPAELDPSIFPPLVPSGSVIGHISKPVAQEVGLTDQVAIVSGGHDHLCAAYASGIRRRGELFISAGTSEAQLLLTKKPILNATGAYPIDQGCFVDDEHYYIMSSLPSGHIFKQWRKMIFRGIEESSMYRELESVPVGSEGVRFQLSPDLQTEALHGLTYHTDRAAIMHAILEGLAVKSAEITRVLTSLTGDACNKIIASGHPTKVDLWKRIRVAVYAMDLSVVEEAESTALGAALLAQKPFTDGEQQSASRTFLQPKDDLSEGYRELCRSYAE